jgi:hypothetical protein
LHANSVDRFLLDGGVAGEMWLATVQGGTSAFTLQQVLKRAEFAGSRPKLAMLKGKDGYADARLARLMVAYLG